MAIEHVTDESFETAVIGADTPVLVDFWANWCAPCLQIAPMLEQISEEMTGTIRVVKLDIDDNPEAPARYGVRGIPTLLIFRDGEIVGNKVGATSKVGLVKWIETSLA